MGSDTPMHIQAGVPPPPWFMTWPRADQAALAAFDTATKRCTHNCGPALNDPRTAKERLYLCDLCGPAGKEQIQALSTN